MLTAKDTQSDAAVSGFAPLAGRRGIADLVLRFQPGPIVNVCVMAQVVFLGLDIVVPLMSVELLAVPKLARLYFALLSYLLEIWPDRLAALPCEQAAC